MTMNMIEYFIFYWEDDTGTIEWQVSCKNEKWIQLKCELIIILHQVHTTSLLFKRFAVATKVNILAVAVYDGTDFIH